MPTETSPPKRGRKPKQPAPVEPMQTTEQIVRIPLIELHPFPDHPYGIREDQAMQDTVDSVKQNGVVVPAIVRPRAEGGYEIVAGHRRKLASEQAGFTDMPCIIRNLTDDEAIIQLVDSNAQREDVLPSERAKAYKMRLEAIKRTAGRPRKEISDKEVAHEIENESLLLLRRRATVRKQLHALARTDVAEVAARAATTSALDVRAFDDQSCHSSSPAMPRACCSNEMRPLVSFTFRTLSRRSACRAASLHS